MTTDLTVRQHAERTILGACIVDQAAAMDATAALQPWQFGISSHRVIFEAIGAMQAKGTVPDLQTLSGHLGTTALNAIGGRAYLSELMDVPRRLNVQEYIRQVRDAALAREGLLACDVAMEKLKDDANDPAAVLDELGKAIVLYRPCLSLPVAEVLPQALACLDTPKPAFRTGIAGLDLKTRGGIRPQELWVIGALPSGGKSALLRQLERQLMPHGVHTHSIEVPREDWTRFHVAALAGIGSGKLQEAHLMTPADKDRMRRAAAEVEQWNYVIDDGSSVDAKSLLSRSRLSHLRHGTPDTHD